MKKEYIQKIYAGWFAKIIGIRLGAPIEGWTYAAIQEKFGEQNGYLCNYKNFAADDDSNGPLFFVRALEDSKDSKNMAANDIADAMLNYVPFEHGFFWWGGYGISTEHTAYLNLRNAIPAPQSGSIEQNGLTVAEQIGGQIFIDCWGLVAPNNPELAAHFATLAASVTHDGNGIYGGVFVAVCVSCAFDETNIEIIIEKGLSFIPKDCEYTHVVKAVMAFYKENPQNWHDCFKYIFDNFGYDKYSGNCHIIPNAAVMILSLLYGEGEFSKTIEICNFCGWDTDCNVGNVATIMGVRGGLASIESKKWREPINDLLICSSVLGCLNISDIPFGAAYMAQLAYKNASVQPDKDWSAIFDGRIDSCHFEFEGSTHAFRTKSINIAKVILAGSDEQAATGLRSLKVRITDFTNDDSIYVYKQMYYSPKDFDDSRYDPCFSPLVYPGQTICGSVFLSRDSLDAIGIALYVKELKTDKIYQSKTVMLVNGKWLHINFDIPFIPNAIICEAGFVVENCTYDNIAKATLFVDDFYIENTPNYNIDFSTEYEEKWHYAHSEISQMSRLKGNMFLQNGRIHLSCTDFGEAYTGHLKWTDYVVEFHIVPNSGDVHRVNFRVQGAIRSYAAALLPNGKFALCKNENSYHILKQVDFDWQHGHEYSIKISVKGKEITATLEDVFIVYEDCCNPYLNGCIGFSVSKNSHISCSNVKVFGCN